jgi:hypothetical protein
MASLAADAHDGAARFVAGAARSERAATIVTHVSAPRTTYRR